MRIFMAKKRKKKTIFKKKTHLFRIPVQKADEGIDSGMTTLSGAADKMLEKFD